MSKIKGFRDRGAAKHFRGRETILSKFREALEEFSESKGGTIFLVQGPPGVGKTALLAKCWDIAEEQEWEVAEIDPRDLWDPDKLRKTLEIGPEIRVTGGEGEAGITKFLVAKGKAKITVDHHPRTPQDILKIGDTPLLLILDEAQHLGEDSRITGGYKDDVRDLLKRIHNSGLGKPVILLAGGLGTTDRALNSLGIYRASLGSITNLDPLEEEEEWTVIREWLKEEGKAKGDTTDWVDAIAKETYRWPQHIIAYTVPAAAHLKENDGEMTRGELLSVLEQGRKNRREYYEGRLSDFTAKECRSLARILAASSKEGIVEQEDVIEQLDREYGMGKGEEIFWRAVRKGVFYLNKKLRCYSVPIPSLRNFIVRNFPPKEISEQHPESKDQGEPRQLPEADPEE